MTYNGPNHPNELQLPPVCRYEAESASNTSMWVVGALAILAILGVLIYALSNTGTQTASTTPPATTGAGPTTTGTGKASQPATPLPNPKAPAPASNR